MTMRTLIPFLLLALLTAPPVAGAEDRHDHDKPEPSKAEAGKHDDHEGHDEGGADAIHLTPEQLGRLDVEVAEAQAGSANARIRLPATVRFDADRIARIGPRLPAKVVEVTRDLGERVEPGDPVAILDSVALGRAKAEYLAARARLETARADYRRERKLAEQAISSEAERLAARARFREAQVARDAAIEELRLYGLSRGQVEAIDPNGDAPLSRLRLTSPIAGVVQERNLTPGQSVAPSETPLHVVDTGEVWLMIDAYERHLPLLEPGQPVAFRSRALDGQAFEGETDWVSRALDEKTRTLRVRAVLPNPDGLLRQGMFGTAAVTVRPGGEAAMVPVDAVQQLEGRPVVFVPGEEAGGFHARTVTLGEEADGRVEVLAGLHPHEPLVVHGAFDLKSALTASGRSAAHHH
ncbi:MAG TPA: efflux RND transporter periplasmic adaptor subunit [Gammaproteobacteria bacterium]|nr:efflux RND transporter periplasmic adaptor subunit [Gammaproteobacteria bacterium]